jgi:transcriptional regulator GlxA family with amidase domain
LAGFVYFTTASKRSAALSLSKKDMPTTFAFLVLPEVHLMDLAGPDQTIHEAIEYGADFTMEYCGLQEGFKSSAGLGLAKQPPYSKLKLNRGDFLFIPGSNLSYVLSKEFKENKKLHHWIKDCHARGVNLVSICAGVFVLAQCDLLNGIECTTHFKRTKQLQELFPKAIVRENILYSAQGTIYTSAGIASGIDLTLHIVEQLCGSYFAHKVARELVIYNRRNGEEEQQSAFMAYRNHIHSGVHNAQDYVVEHLHKKLSVDLLAEEAYMSPRNFTRIFKRETGITVHAYIQSIRKERIKQLMANKDLTRKQIARQVGLESERQLSRLLLEV